LSSFPRQLRVITGRGPFAHTYPSQLHVPTFGYPNYIQLGVMGRLARLYSVGVSISFDRPRPHSTTLVVHNNGSRIPNS